MRFKPKTVRRLTLLAVAMVLVLGIGFALFFVRRWQSDRRTESHRRDGLAALAEGRHRQAMQELGRYIQRGRSSDAEAWLALARARLAIEEADFSHLRHAIDAYQQYLALRPQDAEAGIAFLKLCNQAGLYVETRDAAQRLRPAVIEDAGPAHVEVLREEATALAASKQFGPRLTSVVDRLLILAPLDLQANLIRLESMARTDQYAQARQHAQEVLRAHPDEPVAQVISAASWLLEPSQSNVDVARVKLAQSVGLDPLTAKPVCAVSYPGAAFVARVVDIFDRIEAYDLALGVLRRYHAQGVPTPANRIELGVLRTLARRLWQQGEYEGVVSLAGEFPVYAADSEILAFAILSLQRLDGPTRNTEAGAMLEQLKVRVDDYRAKAWVAALPIADPSRKADPLTDSETLRTAIKVSNRQEPVIEVLLGESLAALSRLDEAREAWKGASESAVSAGWTYPHIRIAETLLSEGRPDEADAPATKALRIAHDSPMVNALWFEVQAVRLQRGSTGEHEPSQILATLERAMDQVERAPNSAEVRAVWERLLPSRVLFLAKTGNGPRAVEITRIALDSPERLSERTLQRLASVSASEHLGLESECLARAAGVNRASPGVAFAQAIELARAGKVDQGLSLLQAAADTAEGRLALARFLETIGHAGAAESWIKLGDDFAFDVNVQRACLWSRIVGEHPEFVERTIDRYRSLSGLDPGSDDPPIRTARARVLLSGTPTSKDRDSAIALLASVVTPNPKLVEPKLALAQALLLSDPTRGVSPEHARAAAQLTDALALEPRSPEIALQLAAVLQHEREFTRARDILVRLSGDATADAHSRHAAARLLIAQGGDSVPLAIATLIDIDAQAARAHQATPAGVLADLGEAHALRREDERAAQAFTRLIEHPDANADQLYLAARFHQSVDREAERVATVERLESPNFPPGAKACVLARLAEDCNDATEGVHQFEIAVSVAPGEAQFWSHYIKALLARSRAAEATRVGERAVKANPENHSLIVLLEQARLAVHRTDTADLGPLIAAMSNDPAFAELTEVVRALDEAGRRGDLDDPERVMQIADRFPSVAVLQIFLAQRLVPIDAARTVDLVGRARTVAPGNAAIAKAAAEVFLSLGRWTEMLSAAAAWKELDTKRTPEPDVAIAQARLALHDYRGGLIALESWLDKAIARPGTSCSLGVLNMQTRLLIASGKEDEARGLIEPLLAEWGTVRTAIWLRSAAEAVPSVDAACSWIDRVRPRIPADAVDEQLAVAGAWSMLATRFPDQSGSLLAEATAFLERRTSASTSTAPEWEALGVVRHRTGDLKGAEAAYTEALNRDPKRIICLNNLATILYESKGDLDAAVKLARRAVDASPDAAALSTLGSIQYAIARRDRKTGASEAAFKPASDTYACLAKRRPRDVQAWSMAGQVAGEAGDWAGAEAAWQRIVEMSGVPPTAGAAAKNNLANAILRQQPSREQIEQARVLAAEAISVADEPAYRDTLGWAELAAGGRERAIAEFRKALGKSEPGAAPLKSAVIGLATALASGSPAERREAASLAAAVDPVGLDPHLAAKLDTVRSLVQVEKP